MAKLTDAEIESTITQAHADVLAHATGNASHADADRGIVRTLRGVYTIGRDQGTYETIERAVNLLGSPISDVSHEQLARSVATIVKWCDEGDTALECRSYNVRRTVFTDPERKWCATASTIGAAYPLQHFGASHAEAIARLATWCGERLNHDEQTQPTGYGDELSQVAR